jgi:predicted amidophosphoribosyltransferase
VLAVKFERWADLGARLGRVLGRRVLAAGLVAPERAVVVPMPMPWPRRWHRGIDHAGTIAEGVGAVLGAPCVPVLRRAHGSPPQVTLAPARRRRLGGRGLAVRRPARGWGLRALDLVVVDDVLTTGASVRAAVRRLRRLGPRRVVVAVLAVSDETARRQREAPVTTPSSDFRQFDGRAY